MKLTVTYEVSGEWAFRSLTIPDDFRGPLRTGTEAANAQLRAEGKKLKLKLIDVEVEP